MDTGKRLDDDSSPSEVPRLKGCMLPTAPLAIVGITYDYPRHVLGLVVPCCTRDITILSSELVTDLVHGHIECIGGTVEKKVVG